METETTSQDQEQDRPNRLKSRIKNRIRQVSWKSARNLIGYWLLGLCNNYAYVIMLSGAYDILEPEANENLKKRRLNSTRDCHPLSTGTILLANILPDIVVKLVAPFIGITTFIRIIIVVTLSAASFILVATAIGRHWQAFLGVVCASVSCGLGGTTLLGYASYFEKNIISTWASGTGAAGVVGAGSYALLTLEMKPPDVMWVMLVVPVIMFMSFYFLLKRPKEEAIIITTNDDSDQPAIRVNTSLKWKLLTIKELLPYGLPLFTTYFAEYFINQGLTELIYFKGFWLNHDEQYRWFELTYQLGVFISRSTVNCCKCPLLWLPAFLQVANLTVFLIEVNVPFIPSVWIIFALKLFEGLLAGGSYVNTFYKIREKVLSEKLEFSLAATPFFATLAIALAGAIAVPVHDYYCQN